MQHISILYFQGCPNHPPVVDMAHQLVAEFDISAEIEEIDVNPEDVVSLKFLGSPTVQVDGVDIEPAARSRTDFAMSCRVYATPQGLPSKEMFLNALGVGTSRKPKPVSDRAGQLAIGSSLVTAILSSACCWLPLLLLGLGASSAGVSAFFEPWRPLFMGVAVVMLILGFYFSYFRKTACGDACCANGPTRSQRIQRMMLWSSTVVVVAFILFPRYIGKLMDNGSSQGQTISAAADQGGQTYIFDVDGMSCSACAVTLQSELVNLDGVTSVQIDYDTKTAQVRATGDQTTQHIIQTTKNAGYTATLRTQN